MKSFFHTYVPYISQFFLLSISSLDVEDLYLLNEVYDTSLWCGPLTRQTFQTSLNSLSFPTKKKKNEYKYHFENIIERWKWGAIMTINLTDGKVFKLVWW